MPIKECGLGESLCFGGMDRRRCHKGQRAMIAPQINLMGCDTATKSLVFEAVLSSLISDMVLFGCTGILRSKASSKLKPMNGFWAQAAVKQTHCSSLAGAFQTRLSTVSEGHITTQENNMEVELPAPTNPRKHVSVPSGPHRNACPAVAEIPFPVVSEEVEEQVHSIQGSSSANPANSVGRKLYIVEEIEKMKTKGREETRAQNSGMRMKQAQEYDNRFPTWEFAMIKEFQATFDCHPLNMTDPIEEHRICVCVRKHLLIKQELSKKEIDVISVPSKCLLFVHEPWLKMYLTKYPKNQAFCFDFALEETASNEVVYRFTDRPLVHTIFKGGKATCFAYGQRGSDKTHTMGGSLYGKALNASKVISVMASHDIFVLKNQPSYRNLGLEVHVTFFEIYNGKLFDLCNKKAKLRILEDRKQQVQVQVLGLQEHMVSCADDVIRMLDIESACRSPSTIFIADQQTCMEGTEIKTSLLAMKECIRALGQNKAHTPFRQSKLTQVLQDSFIWENSRTCMIATISPGISSCEYTVNTLRYADRVKELSPHNGPIGEHPVQMKVEETEAILNGSLTADNFPKEEEEELSSQMSSFNEVMTQIRELEERDVEELKEIIQPENPSSSQLGAPCLQLPGKDRMSPNSETPNDVVLETKSVVGTLKPLDEKPQFSSAAEDSPESWVHLRAPLWEKRVSWRRHRPLLAPPEDGAPQTPGRRPAELALRRPAEGRAGTRALTTGGSAGSSAHCIHTLFPQGFRPPLPAPCQPGERRLASSAPSPSTGASDSDEHRVGFNTMNPDGDPQERPEGEAGRTARDRQEWAEMGDWKKGRNVKRNFDVLLSLGSECEGAGCWKSLEI
ncbi:LOW QUALITY PROTEIN: kinesin-like protein KIF2C [Glossophaga mutica]